MIASIWPFIGLTGNRFGPKHPAQAPAQLTTIGAE